MERLQIEERFLANFEAVSSEGNESYESLRSVSSYDSELVVSDFTVSLTPSPICSSLSTMLHETENQIEGRCDSDSEGGDRVGRCYSQLSGESVACHPENPFTFKKVRGKKKKIIFYNTLFRFMRITSVLTHHVKIFIPREKHPEKHESPAKV
jgi:hypothetical protein